MTKWQRAVPANAIAESREGMSSRTRYGTTYGVSPHDTTRGYPAPIRFRRAPDAEPADRCWRVRWLRRSPLQNAGRSVAEQQWGSLSVLERLVEGEVNLQRDRSIRRHISPARFPVKETLDSFDRFGPKKTNRLQVRNLFRLRFLDEPATSCSSLSTAAGWGNHTCSPPRDCGRASVE